MDAVVGSRDEDHWGGREEVRKCVRRWGILEVRYWNQYMLSERVSIGRKLLGHSETVPHTRKYRPLLRDPVLHNDIIGGYAISRDEEQRVVVDFEEVAYFAGGDFFEAGA
jgi:hypothetical protein